MAAYIPYPIQGVAVAPTKIDLAKTIRDKSISLLNPALAGATELMLATKEAHWNVKGPNFIALHELFDKFNAEVSVYVDDLAERIVQLGGHAPGTAQEVVKAKALTPYPQGKTGERDHLRGLISQTSELGAIVREGIDRSTDAGDADTADLLTSVSRGLDKQLWFLEAHLG
jgi:starvation-inducible DNA-binding protein